MMHMLLNVKKLEYGVFAAVSLLIPLWAYYPGFGWWY